MKALFRNVCLLTVAILIAASSPQTLRSTFSVKEAVPHGALLGKSLSDPVLRDLLTANHCVSAAPFQICKDAGMAFWLNAEQFVQKVYLYLNNEEGFVPYKGDLPLGLKFYDTMGAVEYKLRKLETGDSLSPAEGAGLPEEGGSPDHMHYWAIYKRYGLTIIYNSPFTDEDATIYAIVLNG